MAQELLETVEINPDLAPRSSVIWLHGLGADGNDFVPIVSQLNLSAKMGVRFVFPHAPVMPVTINNGFRMPAWFDIYGLSHAGMQDEAGIHNSQRAIEALIAREVNLGIAPEHIVLAGFSQGGAMALYTGLRYPKPLAGILALSAFLPLADKLPAEASAANKNIPIFMAHGHLDPMVPIDWAKTGCEYLKKLGYQVEWHSYPMQHAVCVEEINDIAQWLARILA